MSEISDLKALLTAFIDYCGCDIETKIDHQEREERPVISNFDMPDLLRKMSRQERELKSKGSMYIIADDGTYTSRLINPSITYKVTKRPKQQPVPRKSNGSEYTQEFEEAWKAYPNREGGSSKIEAYGCWNARLKESKDLTDEAQLMIAGVKRYAAFINANGSEGTKFVKAARTFFGVSKHYLDAHELPKVRHDAIKLPAMDADLKAFVNKHKLSQAGKGELYPEWRKRLTDEVRKLNKAKG